MPGSQQTDVKFLIIPRFGHLLKLLELWELAARNQAMQVSHFYF